MSIAQPLRHDVVTPYLEKTGKPGLSLAAEVKEQSGTDLFRCYQCRSCGNGCPFVQAMDYTPNQVLRLVQFGMRREVLSCKTIWICVGCHTCSSQCPMSIDIASVMDTLRLMAVEEGVAIGKPNIIDFHEEVLRSLEKYGRAHKLGIMLGYKRQTGRWLKDLDVGLKMLAKRKLDLIPSRVRDVKEITELFQCYWRESA
ncbi:MAG: 4Fe-4S dicluster domain-containing protein [Syntrophales bacterium]|nr:4Fe-4S dicluster domain-containing protein [Syntrophales bacterium]MDD5643523.1 4Fe-4S dicluster domain-containing protein [Syntrophales bacterium]